VVSVAKLKAAQQVASDDRFVQLLSKRYRKLLPLYEKWMKQDQDFARWLTRIPSDHSKVEYFYYMTRFHKITKLTPQQIVEGYKNEATKQELVDTLADVIADFKNKGTLSVGRMIWAAVCSLLMRRGAIRYFREFEISEPKSETIQPQYIPTDGEFSSMLHYAECKRDQFLLVFSRYGGGRRGTLDDPEPLRLRNVLDLDLATLMKGKVRFKHTTSCAVLVYGTVQDDAGEAITRFPETYAMFLLPEAMQFLREYLEERLREGEQLTGSSYLFTVERTDDRSSRYLTATRATGIVSRISKRAGYVIPNTGEAKFTIHSLRRLFYNSLQGIDDVDKEALDGHIKGVRARYHGTVDEMRKAVEFMRGKYELGMRTYTTARSQEQRKQTIIDFARLQGVPEEQIRQLERIDLRKEPVDHLMKLARNMQDEAKRQTAAKKKQPSRTAHNGGTPLDSLFETRIVGEEELVPLLNRGFDVVRELSNGRIVVRRPLSLEEAVSGEE
jgi:integrase